MFAFYTSLSKPAKYSKLCVFLTDLESGRDHRNLVEAFVYSEFDMDNFEMCRYTSWFFPASLNLSETNRESQNIFALLYRVIFILQTSRCLFNKAIRKAVLDSGFSSC